MSKKPVNESKKSFSSTHHYWHNALLRFNICHRIDANEVSSLRHDARLLAIQVEHLAVKMVLKHIVRPIPQNRSPELTG